MPAWPLGPICIQLQAERSPFGSFERLAAIGETRETTLQTVAAAAAVAVAAAVRRRRRRSVALFGVTTPCVSDKSADADGRAT